MGEPKSPLKFWSLWIFFGFWLVLVGAATYFGGNVVAGFDLESKRQGLNNVATIGGVASGLSLTGTTVLSLSGNSMQKLLRRYGAWMRSILFGGYTLMVMGAFAAGLFAMTPGAPFAPWIASGSAAVIFSLLVITALMINSSFVWQKRGTSEASSFDFPQENGRIDLAEIEAQVEPPTRTTR